MTASHGAESALERSASSAAGQQQQELELQAHPGQEARHRRPEGLRRDHPRYPCSRSKPSSWSAALASAKRRPAQPQGQQQLQQQFRLQHPEELREILLRRAPRPWSCPFRLQATCSPSSQSPRKSAATAPQLCNTETRRTAQRQSERQGRPSAPLPSRLAGPSPSVPSPSGP